VPGGQVPLGEAELLRIESDVLLGEVERGLREAAAVTGPGRANQHVHEEFPQASSASRSSIVSRRRMTRDLPSPTRTTAGRGTALYVELIAIV
jgi:hypothetical protein